MHALYVSHTGMSEPLGSSQVVPYLQGLARGGWQIDVVAFEPPGASPDRIERVRSLLARDAITYHWTRRSPSHSLTTKLAESGRAFLALLLRALRRRPKIIHARSYLPGAVAKMVATLSPDARFVFDCRGLLGDEYVDFGHWARDSFRYRLIKAAERQLFGRADAVVVLTERLRRWLRDEAHLVATEKPIEVIPCCVDLDHFRFDPLGRERARRDLAVGDRMVVAYAGTLGAWYCEAQMAELFAAIRRRRPALLAVFTRAPTDRLRKELHARGISDDDLVVRSADQAEMPVWLSAGDVAISFAEPRFSKIASSPVKVAEYLAVGLPVVANRGVGDQDELMIQHPESLIDVGAMSPRELDEAASRIAATAPLDERGRERQRGVALERFALDRIGVARYRDLYARLVS